MTSKKTSQDREQAYKRLNPRSPERIATLRKIFKNWDSDASTILEILKTDYTSIPPLKGEKWTTEQVKEVLRSEEGDYQLRKYSNKKYR